MPLSPRSTDESEPTGMSSFPVVKAESAGLLITAESSLGVAGTTWYTLQPNAGGLKDFYLKLKTVAPSPLTRLRQLEAPQIVDADAVPAITHDLTKDLQDQLIESMMLSATKHTGGTGLSYFTPTAVSSTVYTVAASGALQSGTLIYARGFTVAGNNGLKVVGASSTGTTIPTSGLAAETVSGYLATVEVAGFQGAAADITLDVNGNLTSTVADFTTMGLLAGMWIFVGDGAGTAFSFATAAYRGAAKIVSVAAHLITLERRSWTVAAADPGTGKTIRLLWGRWLRTVAFTDADYKEPSNQFEIQLLDLSGGTTDEFIYAKGNLTDQWKVSAPVANLVTVDLTMLGTTIADPTTTRSTGASAAFNPLAVSRYNTTTGVFYNRVANKATEATVADDIENWNITYMNHIVGQKQIGTLGNARVVVGKAEMAIDGKAFLTQDDAIKACSGNTTLTFAVGMRNPDGGILFDAPSVKCTDAPPDFAANAPVSLGLKMGAFRDPTGNFTLGTMLWPYLPQA